MRAQAVVKGAVGGLAALAAWAWPAAAQDEAAASSAVPLSCSGEIAQGGLALCRTASGAVVEIGGEPAARADADGWATLGFARDAARRYEIQAVAPSGETSAPLTVSVADREFIESEVGGLDCNYVAPPPDPAIQAEIARSTREKNAAWREFNDGPGARAGFIEPGEGDQTSPYGSRRRKFGDGCENFSIHWGLDQRAAVGASVRAPARGVVTLADNLYFEGGAVFLDHGHGLVSIFMHLSEIDVEPGQTVSAGDLLGLAGMTGTANGPHIHWGLKWRNVFHEDGVTGAFYVDPTLALSLVPLTE